MEPIRLQRKQLHRRANVDSECPTRVPPRSRASSPHRHRCKTVDGPAHISRGLHGLAQIPGRLFESGRAAPGEAAIRSERRGGGEHAAVVEHGAAPSSGAGILHGDLEHRHRIRLLLQRRSERSDFRARRDRTFPKCVRLILGASVADNPTIGIVPIQGEEFARRILPPLDHMKFDFRVITNMDPEHCLNAERQRRPASVFRRRRTRSQSTFTLEGSGRADAFRGLSSFEACPKS